MNNQRIKIIVTVGLVVVLLLVWGNSLKVIKGRLKPAASFGQAAVQKPDQALSLPKKDLNAQREEEIRRYESLVWERSHFSGKAFSALTSGADIKLNGISGSGNDIHAVINGHLAWVGDKIEQYTIVEIGSNRVILNDGLKTIVLSLE